MYVCAGNIERRGSHLFNTAVLFDRRGRLVGQYDKTHLTIGELQDGFSCGSEYPVFDLDFGRVGIHICYDEWFPEVARLYAHRGAEVLFLPVAGGKPITWRTRALDNGMHFVSASITPPSMIIESSGVILAQTHDDGVVYADLNLERRAVNWYRDPTLSYGMPCVVPEMRNVADGGLTGAPFTTSPAASRTPPAWP
jgi:predicted amidohydrolase